MQGEVEIDLRFRKYVGHSLSEKNAVEQRLKEMEGVISIISGNTDTGSKTSQ